MGGVSLPLHIHSQICIQLPQNDSLTQTIGLLLIIAALWEQEDDTSVIEQLIYKVSWSSFGNGQPQIYSNGTYCIH